MKLQSEEFIVGKTSTGRLERPEDGKKVYINF
jgi:hypothetical protein